MTENGWVKVIEHANSSESQKMLLAKFLADIDKASEVLQSKGYKITGQSLLSAVSDLPLINND